MSCATEPDTPTDASPGYSAKGALILCEGLWNYDNSTLTRIGIEIPEIVNEYYQKANPGFKLGDTANDIEIKGDTAFIVVFTPGVIEAIKITTGETLGRVFLPEDAAPRDIAVNGKFGYITDLFESIVYKIDLDSLSFTGIFIETGPQPEAISVFNNMLIVANSGYGDYNSNHPEAGTISVFDLQTLDEIEKVYCGPNVQELIVNSKTQKAYACYYHLPSQRNKNDSIGGIVEYDSGMNETARWRINATKINFNPDQDKLYFLTHFKDSTSGISYIDLEKEASKIELFTENKTGDFWYSVAQSPSGNIWAGNARNYQTSGEIMIFDESGEWVHSFPCGINPSKIVFY